MRELKFKVWDIVHKKWLGTFTLKELCMSDIFIDYGIRNIEIVQYIGKKDMTKTEIYENDIVDHHHKHGKWRQVIEWKHHHCEQEEILGYEIDENSESNVEIIGNKFENPELWKESK